MPLTPTRADDLYGFQVVSGAEMSPDGARVAFAVERVDRETEKKHSNLWVAPTERVAPRQFTYGEQRDTSPQWSLGVDTEMVRFPNEPNGLSRGGRTDRRIATLNHIVRWFDRYLNPGQNAT